MSGKIIILDEFTANQIAAGEVVERPASVLKELIENSIDAKSDRIDIEIKNGGIGYIKVSDNGNGIEKDDIPMAFERHGTSKIRQISDIYNISTMGFRGEALPSIASVSNVSITTKTKEQDFAVKVVYEALEQKSMSKSARAQGTTIEVKNLTKYYKEFLAVDNITFDINEGELFSLLGVNGAGKTTTIKMLSGLLNPSSGDAKVLGLDIITDMAKIKSKINDKNL